MKIFKYEIFPGEISVALPKGAKILTAQAQRDRVMLWALVEPNAPTEIRRFYTYPTGTDIEGSPGDYISTFKLYDRELAFHVFEKT